MIREAIDKIAQKQNLTEREMEGVFSEIMGGTSNTDTIVRFLLILKAKGESIDEITGAAKIMRKFATSITPKSQHLLDTCGTGGDNKHTFNISTISAFVAAGAGIAVAKHGNKAVSSKCGSANLLEALGVNINIEKEDVEKCINEVGIGFLFAPKLHLAMKYAMPARQRIKQRSIFNILGPLTNPAGAKFQLLGVFDKKLVKVIASVLKNLGAEHAMVVHGKDGLDEVTTTTETIVAELKDNRIKEYGIRPENYGIKRAGIEDLSGSDTSYNARLAIDILKGKLGPGRDIVSLNAGCAIYVANVAKEIREGIELARKSIDSGAAFEKLEKLKEMTK